VASKRHRKRRLRRTVLAVAVLALVLIGTAGSQEQPPLRGVALERAMPSKALRGNLSFEVYLPPGYARTTARFPVVYFLHGLPASRYAFRSMRAFEEALDRTGGRAILVVPQGARDGDSDPEYLDWGTGRNWETAIGSELPRYVDGHFRTIANRRGRALVGLSAGGYGAVLLALHHLDSYSLMESWSGYFHPTNPSGTAALDLGSAAANRHASAHSFVRSLRRAFRRRPTFFAFYVGRGDDRFRDENQRLHRELAAARVPHEFELYRGGHEQTLWKRHAVTWLRLALAHLERPS
jgi:putative tributyrin esterase